VYSPQSLTSMMRLFALAAGLFVAIVSALPAVKRDDFNCNYEQLTILSQARQVCQHRARSAMEAAIRD
jgi:hypothetical protein